MRINIKNKEKLAKALDEVQARARVRKVSADNIIDFLSNIKIPKAKLNGTVVKYDGGERFPNSYRYRPESTHWEAFFYNGNWYVTNISRGTCPNRNYSGKIYYGDKAKEYILEESSKI